MSELIVGVADLQFSDRPDAIISTYALGSCIGVTLYDPRRKIAGMLHAMLPCSSLHGPKADRRPMFVDTGMADLLSKFRSNGMEPSQCECKIFGAAQVMQADNYFKIGQKNINAFAEIAQTNRLRVLAQEIGGQFNRTIKIHLANGMVSVKTPNQELFWR